MKIGTIKATWRYGYICRILDVRGRDGHYVFTMAFDHKSHGGTYSPAIQLFTANGTKMREVRIPHISFATGLKWEKLGGLWAYKLNSRIIHKLFMAG